jgi:hypothetical protein
MSTRIRFFWKQALKCRELAIGMASKDIATRLVDLADEFETLARESEARKPKSPERTLH